MADADVRGSFDAPDDDLTPDPSFWGPRPAANGRHRRRRPAGLTERVAAAVPSRDARTAIAAVVAVLTVTTVLVAYRASAPTTAPALTPPATSPRPARPVAVTPRRVEVHVAGAVTHPGVVTLAGTDRVIDAIDTAGGARPDANLDAVNLAARLRDGQQILVPSTLATPTAPLIPTPPPSSAPPSP